MAVYFTQGNKNKSVYCNIYVIKLIRSKDFNKGNNVICITCLDFKIDDCVFHSCFFHQL